MILMKIGANSLLSRMTLLWKSGQCLFSTPILLAENRLGCLHGSKLELQCPRCNELNNFYALNEARLSEEEYEFHGVKCHGVCGTNLTAPETWLLGLSSDQNIRYQRASNTLAVNRLLTSRSRRVPCFSIQFESSALGHIFFAPSTRFCFFFFSSSTHFHLHQLTPSSHSFHPFVWQ